MKYRKQTNCVFYCDYHIVISTKYRKKIFNQGVFAYLNKRLNSITEHYPEILIKEINHDKDHIHMLVSIPPKRSVGWFIRIFKANTAKQLKDKFPFIKKVYWGTESIWSKGYFVSTLGITESVIREYIKHQGKQDSGQAQLELA